MSALTSSPEPLVSLAEVRAFLRLDENVEEALLAGLVRAASGICEAFLNQVILRRPFTEVIGASSEWQALRIQPVQAIEGVRSIGSDGSLRDLPPESFAISLDVDGRGWVRVNDAGFDRLLVSGVAGFADVVSDVPEPIRQGVLRLVAHLFTFRDGPGGEPPAAVTALWRPYRRMRLA